MPSLSGKVAVVTGSAQGIGAALAVALAAEGAKVVVSDITDCAETARHITGLGGEAIDVRADVTDNKSLRELVATAETALGPVNVLVNNAGIFGTLELKPLTQISEDEWDAVFRVNARWRVSSHQGGYSEHAARWWRLDHQHRVGHDFARRADVPALCGL